MTIPLRWGCDVNAVMKVMTAYACGSYIRSQTASRARSSSGIIAYRQSKAGFGYARSWTRSRLSPTLFRRCDQSFSRSVVGSFSGSIAGSRND